MVGGRGVPLSSVATGANRHDVTRFEVVLDEIFAGLSRQYGTLVKVARFVNDVRIAFRAISIGALLYTEDKDPFNVIKNDLKPLKVEYV